MSGTWLVVVVFCCLGGCGAVQITALRVPPAVRNGSASTLLDCEYSLRPDELLPDSGLVVKWFFNQGPAPVYQWIPGQRPQELGVLRGRLDLSHRASEHRASVHRALLIATATTELAGEYKCAVSTFQDEDFMSKRMLVFAPGRPLLLGHEVTDGCSLRVTCTASAVYPLPRLALYVAGSPVSNMSVDTVAHAGYYDQTVSALLSDGRLRSPTFIDCQLSIDAAQYVRRRGLLYYPVAGCGRGSRQQLLSWYMLLTCALSKLVLTSLISH